MQLLSIIRTREHSALTISGIDFSGDLDVRVSLEPSYGALPALSVGSPTGSVAIAVGRAGRAGVLFGERSLTSPVSSARWSRGAIEAAITQGDIDDAAYGLADRLLADDRESYSALLAEYEQCHTVRFSGRGRPYVTTVRGNCGLLSFWNEHPGLTIAEEAYASFERWVESGLQNPAGLHPFHIRRVTNDDSDGWPRDVAQIRIGADGQSAEVRLWTAPSTQSAKPILSMKVPLQPSNPITSKRRVVRVNEFSNSGNFSQIDSAGTTRLRKTRPGPNSRQEEIG